MGSVGELAQRVWDYRLATSPFLQLRAGVPITKIRSGSLAELEADAAFASTILAELDALDPSTVAHDDELTRGFLRFSLQSVVDDPKSYWLQFGVTPYSTFELTYTVHSYFGTHQFDGPDDVERYLRLLADFRDELTEKRNKLVGQRERGILLSRPAIPGSRDSLTRHRGAAASLGAIDPARLSSLSESDRLRLEASASTFVAAELLPAFDLLIGTFDAGYEAEAPDGVGFAQYPGGVEFYRSMVRLHTASDCPAEEIHAMGLAEVAALTEQMASARADMGFTGTEAEFHQQLATDPRCFAKDAAEVEARYLGHMARLEPKIGDYFSVLPKAPYGVARLAAEMEAGVTYGYYQVPTPSDEVGRYMYNGSDLDKRSLLTSAALILHELAPGHHFHMARQSENTALPEIRKQAMEIGAFNEGWAEYAAGLGWEMGLYDDPLDRYGRLVHERFTAQRLVIDTGMNLLGWTLERAREYMAANTTESPVQIESETLRYSTDLPGQALSYRFGYLELMRLRAFAEKELGEAFDIRGFHETILGPGALPFPVIDHNVQTWISTQRAEAQT